MQRLRLVVLAGSTLFLFGMDKPKPAASAKEAETEAPAPPPTAPTVAEPAAGIDVVEKDKCVAHWSDGFTTPVDCPAELAGADVGSNLGKENGDCYVTRAESGARKDAKCPEVMTKKATPGVVPPKSSGRSRSCGTCAAFVSSGSADDDAREDLFATTLMAGMTIMAVRRRASRRPRAM